ncbi:MAG: hypothetical protein Kow0073_12630 [Immundisolibacter sp.]
MFSCKDVATHASDYLEGALPWHVTLRLRAHVLMCEGCRHMVRQLRLVSSALGQLGFAADTPPARARHWPERAVSALAGAAAVVAVWLLPGFTGIEQQLYAHAVDRHAHAGTVLDAEAVAGTLAAIGARLTGDLPGVVFADRCPFRGHFIAHLLLHTPHGLVTVMLVPDRARNEDFTRRGYSGHLEPLGAGTLAVLGPDPEGVRLAAAQVRAAVRWHG